ncbi:tetraacyldisaccharide 4'-kinase [Acidicapsa dinghuensis]|uniref:Tetraacyldisaccharide 4'-kinase n=1 Tax=Acidicapsa dinghuensis TaxID=2218256 RepID=A0ABW1EHR7_9BACT|nr:tetraacyldisaccharide 4'-kinase [Acidicapsa dinghuensis]
MRRPWAMPLVPLYGAGLALRGLSWSTGLAPVRKLAWPVVSVGNLSAGGTGKTPFTVALVRLLQERGIAVDVLSRGYGRKGDVTERVPRHGSAEQFGDEPLLIARTTEAPVYVGASRWQAGRLAEREAKGKTGVHLLDDGFQHRGLARQVDIVLVNLEDLRDFLLPAGNLREPFSALARAHVLAVPAQDDEAVQLLESRGFGTARGQKIWRFRREMVLPPMPESLVALPWVAFCGIGRPEQFFAGLMAAGLKLAETRVFADHHPYTFGDIESLRRRAGTTGAGALITTAKDLYRMGDLSLGSEEAVPILAADLKIVIEDQSAAMSWLLSELGHQST